MVRNIHRIEDGEKGRNLLAQIAKLLIGKEGSDSGGVDQRTKKSNRIKKYRNKRRN